MQSLKLERTCGSDQPHRQPETKTRSVGTAGSTDQDRTALNGFSLFSREKPDECSQLATEIPPSLALWLGRVLGHGGDGSWLGGRIFGIGSQGRGSGSYCFTGAGIGWEGPGSFRGCGGNRVRCSRLLGPCSAAARLGRGLDFCLAGRSGLIHGGRFNARDFSFYWGGFNRYWGGRCVRLPCLGCFGSSLATRRTGASLLGGRLSLGDRGNLDHVWGFGRVAVILGVVVATVRQLPIRRHVGALAAGTGLFLATTAALFLGAVACFAVGARGSVAGDRFGFDLDHLVFDLVEIFRNVGIVRIVNSGAHQAGVAGNHRNSTAQPGSRS